MTVFAYCRVSTLDQSAEMQADILAAAYPGCIVRQENASGTNTTARPVLALIIDMLTPGDTVVVWKLDRLARNMRDLLALVDTIKSKDAALKVHDQAIDTSTASGNAFLMMLGVFAEFETSLRLERQMAGIAKAKAEGRALGRKPTIDTAAITLTLNEGLSIAQAAARHNVSRSTVQRVRRLNK